MHEVNARQKKDGSFHTVNEEIHVPSHECCGLVYPGHFSLQEMFE